MNAQVKIDAEAVRSLAELLRETDLTEIEYQIDSLKIKVLRTATINSVVAVNQGSNQSMNQQLSGSAQNQLSSADFADANSDKATDSLFDHPGIIEAQMVGTVYLAPGPDAPHFVSVGDKISQGQTLFIIEAMKVMNMIKAPKSGTVKHIFVKDTHPVEYGDPILIIE